MDNKGVDDGRERFMVRSHNTSDHAPLMVVLGTVASSTRSLEKNTYLYIPSPHSLLVLQLQFDVNVDISRGIKI